MINSSTVFYANLWINESPVKKLNLEPRSQYSRTLIRCPLLIVGPGSLHKEWSWTRWPFRSLTTLKRFCSDVRHEFSHSEFLHCHLVILGCSTLMPVATAVTSHSDSECAFTCFVLKWTCGPTWTLGARSAFRAKQLQAGPALLLVTHQGSAPERKEAICSWVWGRAVPCDMLNGEACPIRDTLQKVWMRDRERLWE